MNRDLAGTGQVVAVRSPRLLAHERHALPVQPPRQFLPHDLRDRHIAGERAVDGRQGERFPLGLGNIPDVPDAPAGSLSRFLFLFIHQVTWNGQVLTKLY